MPGGESPERIAGGQLRRWDDPGTSAPRREAGVSSRRKESAATEPTETSNLTTPALLARLAFACRIHRFASDALINRNEHLARQ